MNIVLYLNMDAIGYLAPPEPDAYMMADSSALAVAAWMCDVAGTHTDYHFIPTIQPLGASDHNSFWEAGYNVVDSQVDPTSHHIHTPDDVIELGMVDLEDNDTWIPIAKTRAWSWQQGCMLQWVPGSDSKIIYNDRENDRFIARIRDVFSGETRQLPRAASEPKECLQRVVHGSRSTVRVR